jgi:hypothetical protein
MILYLGAMAIRVELGTKFIYYKGRGVIILKLKMFC